MVLTPGGMVILSLDHAKIRGKVFKTTSDCYDGGCNQKANYVLIFLS